MRSQHLAEYIRNNRLARAMTQIDLAAASGLGLQTLSNIETGRSHALHINTVRALAKALRIDPLQLCNQMLGALEEQERFDEAARKHGLKP